MLGKLTVANLIIVSYTGRFAGHKLKAAHRFGLMFVHVSFT